MDRPADPYVLLYHAYDGGKLVLAGRNPFVHDRLELLQLLGHGCVEYDHCAGTVGL